MPRLDRPDRDGLILAHQRLVTTIAADFRRVTRARRIEWADVIAEGTLGLVEAADRFDSSRLPAAHFGAWVRIRIWARIYEAVHGHKPREVTGLDLDRLPGKRRLPILIPMFGCAPHTPRSSCPHHGPMPPRSRFCCMVCHTSGWDHLSALELQPGDLPRRTAAALRRAPPNPAHRKPAASAGRGNSAKKHPAPNMRLLMLSPYRALHDYWRASSPEWHLAVGGAGFGSYFAPSIGARPSHSSGWRSV